MPRLASFVPTKDVKKFFSGPGWSGPGWKDDQHFEGTHKHVRVSVSVTGTLYGVHVEAVDDPSDSEDVTTEDPLKAIAEFLSRDLPGGEHFERMSSSPAALATALAAVASSIGKMVMTKVAAVAALRRLAAAVPRTADSDGRPGLEDLESRARKKGWKVRVKDGPHGEEMKVDVSGIYEATVTVEEIIYAYDFSIGDDPDLAESSTTDDPIRELERWYKRDDVQDAKEDLKAEEMGRGTVRAPEA